MARLFDDAQNEYLSVGNAVVSGVPLTMACWFNCDDDTNSQSLMTVGQAGSGNYFWLLAASNGTELRAYTRDAGDNEHADTTAGYNENTWHHACAVFATTTSRAAYIDGGSKGTDATDITPVGLNTTYISRLVYPPANNFPFSGKIAEVGIWDVALTDVEVAALAGRVSPARIRPESLVAYWPLYGIGSPEPDYRGTYNMTLFSDNSGPVQADHAPVQPPFGFDLGPAGIYTVTPAVLRIPRPPAAYNALMVY